MNSIKSLIAILALSLAATPLIRAADQTDTTTAPAEGRRGKGGPRGQGGGRGGQMMNPEARVEQLDRNLTLTTEQKTKLTDIFSKARDDMEGMRQADGDRAANREKMQQAMQATRDQVQSVLTDEQKKKFEALPQGGPGGGRGGEGQRGGPRGGQGQGKRKKGA
jgi:Spy/CpxP family protein refolding chaperone